MNEDPCIEKHINKRTGKKDEIYFSIYCNTETIGDIRIEQLVEIHSLIGKFIEEKGGQVV